MSTLARQQQILLDALLSWPAENAMKNIAACAIDTGSRGIKAYQTNCHMLAQRALQAAYPVVAQMVGDKNFADLATYTISTKRQSVVSSTGTSSFA